jgi:hypothetical protein
MRYAKILRSLPFHILSVGKTEEDSKIHYELQVLSNAGKLSRKRRDDALSEFNAAFFAAKKSLVALRDSIKTKRAE